MGLPLAAGRTTDELLSTASREDYEAEPFEHLLLVFGLEVEEDPPGRWFCDRVWNFDTECIEGTGSYVAIAEQLLRISGRAHDVTGLRDHVDGDTGLAWLAYTVDGRERRWDVEVNEDWADLMVVSYLMDDLERDGSRFYAMDNGQAMVLLYLSDPPADRLNELAGRQLITPYLA